MTREELMRETFTLAKQGLGTTWPNPLVGAVIVKNEKIIGRGYHRKQGGDHAEIDALKNCTESPEGSTIYVNLEPCCHTNKTTPPCAQRLVKEKVKKVVISNLDPNPAVNGQGVALLRENGIEVEHGILAEEGEALNEVFFLAQRKRRPFLHFKTAGTLDGKIALPNGESQWITSEKAREHVHYLRSLHQAVMTGGETVRKDNPRLTVRVPSYDGPQPLRVVLSRQKNFSPALHLFSDEFKERTIIFEEIDEALRQLFERKVINVLLECGPGLAGEFFKRGLIDRVSLYQSPSFLGEGFSVLSGFSVPKLNQRPRLVGVESLWIGEDHYITGRLLCSQD